MSEDTKKRTLSERLSEMQRRVASEYGPGYRVTALMHKRDRHIITRDQQSTDGYMHDKLKDGEEIISNELGVFKLYPPDA